MKICVALSGGKDSVALLHYLNQHRTSCDLTLFALHCNHAMRPTADRDEQFVVDLCHKLQIPLHVYHTNTPLHSEQEARNFRLHCYLDAKKQYSADAIATAHHADDNAETVLYHLARGTGAKGVGGIPPQSTLTIDGQSLTILRPLISWTQEELLQYISQNQLSYVTDESNLTDTYARNKIRHHVLPILKEVCPTAVQNIHKFCASMREDEELLTRLSQSYLITKGQWGWGIAPCTEKAIFKRACLIIFSHYHKQDYTTAQLEQLFALQQSHKGKRFEFLGLCAYKEENCLMITEQPQRTFAPLPYLRYFKNEPNGFGGQPLSIYYKHPEKPNAKGQPPKVLCYDEDCLPQDVTIRFAQPNDRFQKFGGGTKTLGDYFTDCKIPLRLRSQIPLLVSGNDVLVIFGVEISEQVKVTENSQPNRIAYAVAVDYKQM